jgi:hypothetical protein
LKPRTLAFVKVEQARENVFTLTMSSQELSALIAAGRIACDAMSEDPRSPDEIVRLLQQVLDDYDHARERSFGTGGHG